MLGQEVWLRCYRARIRVSGMARAITTSTTKWCSIVFVFRERSRGVRILTLSFEMVLILQFINVSHCVVEFLAHYATLVLIKKYSSINSAQSVPIGISIYTLLR